MTMPSDLRAYSAPSWWRDLADEEQSRIAGALSVTAIVMLLVTSFTLARGVQWNETTLTETFNGTSTLQSSQAQAGGAEFQPLGAHLREIRGWREAEIQAEGTQEHRRADRNRASEGRSSAAQGNQAQELVPAAPFDCPRLQGRQWLRAAIWQQGDRTLAGWECVYGYANSERFEQ